MHYAESHPEVKNLFGAQPFNVMPIAWTIRIAGPSFVAAIVPGFGGSLVIGGC